MSTTETAKHPSIIPFPGAKPTAGERRFRTCQIIALPHMAGSQRTTLDQSIALDESRYEMHFITGGEGPLTEELERRGIRYHIAPRLNRAVHPVRDYLALRQVKNICRREQFDLVHTRGSKAGLLGRIAARRAGVPNVVHHVHGYSFHEFSPPHERYIYSKLESLAGRYCDRVVFCNEEERIMSIDEGWLPREKCRTVLNGVDVDSFDQQVYKAERNTFRVQHNVADDELAILFLGRLDDQKQPLILPDIAAGLDALAPNRKWKILVAGSGKYKADLIEKISARKMENRVILLDWVEDPRDSVRGSDIMLLPSLWEGLPRVLLEAHAAGIPSVASEIKGNREVIVPETGMLCSPQIAAEYSAALGVLVSDERQRQAMGAAARKRAIKCYDRRRAARQVEAIYAELLGVEPLHDVVRAAA